MTVAAGTRLSEETRRLGEIAHEAGLIAAAYFRLDERTSAEVFFKEGNSPVTEADLAADGFLRGACAEAFPGCAWMSEETADTGARIGARRTIVVDPIDGTRGFLSGDPRWCVSIAIVEEGRPVSACLSAPALDELFLAEAGQGAFLNGSRLALAPSEPSVMRVYGPKPMAEWLGRLARTEMRVLPRIPSLAYRVAAVAKGDAELGLAGADSHDWDIAAADLILAEAGGALLAIGGERPVYNRPDPVHPPLLAGWPLAVERYAALARAARRGG